ncbi:MAG: response regulator, partial [Pseudobdellovibrio sp.]
VLLKATTDAATPDIKPASLFSAESIFKNKHILVADDDDRNIFALSNALQAKGLKVSMARNGQEALNLLDGQENFDLVLMDIMMPVMDGLEATKRIRMKSSGQNIPIIALTAKAMKGSRESCLAAGANDYLAQPVDMERLFSMLRVWLAKK